MDAKKIVFLDVDGVLNSDKFYEELLSSDEGIDCFREDILDQRAISRVARIIRDTEAQVVISSSWRWDIQAMSRLLEQLNTFDIVPIDTTIEDMRVNMSRAQEIKLWLDQHPEVENYVVLDDEVMNIPEIGRHHIKTNMSRGLEPNHVEQAKKVLNGELI